MTRGPIYQAMWDRLPEDEKKLIKARAAEKIAAYERLQDIRKQAGLTQAKVAEALQMPQGNVSRLEHNSDMLLSTLQQYISAIGGTLQLTVSLPGTPPTPLTGLGDLIDHPHSSHS